MSDPMQELLKHAAVAREALEADGDDDADDRYRAAAAGLRDAVTALQEELDRMRTGRQVRPRPAPPFDE
jgi:hypothetical protein